MAVLTFRNLSPSSIPSTTIVLLHTLLLTSWATKSCSAAKPAPRPKLPPVPPVTTNDCTNFILVTCKELRKLYPEDCTLEAVCLYALTPHFDVVGTSSLKLANASLLVSSQQFRGVHKKIKILPKGGEESKAALADCVETLNSAYKRLRSSFKEPKKSNFQKINLMTWVSAAMSDEVTCNESVEEMKDRMDKKTVDALVGYVYEALNITTLALDLIGKL